MAKIILKQNSVSAALLVITATLLVWFVFNLIVPAYPSYNGSPVATDTTTQRN